MKKFLILLTGCSLFSLGTVQAQSLGDLSNLVNAITDRIGSFDLEGDWEYTGSAVAFKSENFLMNAGGVVAANNVEKKIDEQLVKIGINPGSSRYTFTSDDKFTHTIGSKTFSGTYSYDSDTGYITLTYMRMVPIKAILVGSTSKMELLFDTGEFLSVVAFLGGLSSRATIKSITSIVNQYDGMMVGFELKKN